jgi:RHS repeat-associated protein
LLVDDYELGLIDQQIIPSNRIPLIIQDKSFVSSAAISAGYKWGRVGDLWYPYLYEPDRWELGSDSDPPIQGVIAPLPVPSCVPEFFSDTAIINGAAWPYLEVEPRHYRFQILNGSQARFYNLQLYYEGPPGEANLSRPGPTMVQIGTEGGFLPQPVALNSQPIAFDPVTGNATAYSLLLAPAERADIVVDFSKAPPGSRLILYNDAPAPFPGGDPLVDYYTGAPDLSDIGSAESPAPGYGPNTRTLMQIRVTPLVGAPDPASLNVLESLAVNRTPSNILSANVPASLDPHRGVMVRDLTLNEDFDEYGRLIQRLGTDTSTGLNNQGLPTWARNYMDPATETPKAGTTEIWRILNLTGDTHPIHFHLVNVQVLGYSPPVFSSGVSLAGASVWRGKRIEPNGFYWLGARYYDPVAGRFLSPDPLGHSASWDLYSFCGGDPLNRFDPAGRFGKLQIRDGTLGTSLFTDDAQSELNPLSLLQEQDPMTAGLMHRLKEAEFEDLIYGHQELTPEMLFSGLLGVGANVANLPFNMAYGYAGEINTLLTAQNDEGQRVSGLRQVWAGVNVALPVAPELLGIASGTITGLNVAGEGIGDTLATSAAVGFSKNPWGFITDAPTKLFPEARFAFYGAARSDEFASIAGFSRIGKANRAEYAQFLQRVRSASFRESNWLQGGYAGLDTSTGETILGISNRNLDSGFALNHELTHFARDFKGITPFESEAHMRGIFRYRAWLEEGKTYFQQLFGPWH